MRSERPKLGIRGVTVAGTDPEFWQPMKSDPPVDILYVHNSADIYGASRSLARLLGRLDRRRFGALVVLPEEGPLRRWLEELGVGVVLQPGLPVITRALVRSPGLLAFPFRFLASAVTLRRLIRRRGVGLVHTNTGVIPSPALAARWAGVPHIWHIRDWFQEFRQFWGPSRLSPGGATLPLRNI